MKLATIQRWSLYIFFFSINFEMWDPLDTNGVFSISKLAAYVYFLTLIPQLSWFLNIKSFKKFLWPYFVFFVILSVVNFLNINAFFSQFIDLTMMQNLILIILLVNHSRKEKEILGKAMLSYAMGAILLAFLFYLGVGVEYVSGRVTLFGDNQNVIGIKECIGVTVILVIIFSNKLNLRKWRYLLSAALPVMFVLMIKTGSRTAFISFMLILVTFLFLIENKHRYSKVFIIIAVAILGVFVWRYMSSNSSDILYSRLMKTENSGDLGGRDRVWQAVIPFASEHWVFGEGETGYNYYTKYLFGEIYSPHNVILEVICYTGIIGLFFYFIFLYKISKVSYKRYKSDGSLLQLLLLIPILALLLSAQLLNVKIGYIIFAYCISSVYYITPRLNRRPRNKYLLLSDQFNRQ